MSRMKSRVERTITLDVPFRPDPRSIDAKYAIATIHSRAGQDRVLTVIIWPSRVGFASADRPERMLGDEEEEACARFILAEVAELANRPVSTLEPVAVNRMRELRVNIPAGPGESGEWTLEMVKRHTDERLRNYVVTREGFQWRASTKP